MSSAIYFNLEQSKILSSGNELMEWNGIEINLPKETYLKMTFENMFVKF